jgi:uncharacterized membrane protein
VVGLDKLTALWTGIRDSLWFLPGVLTLGAIILAVVTIQIDVADVLPTAPLGVWLFSSTASGARGVLSAIASSFITVTGVVFSITIVALQLASTQFTPRILRNFTADRANQLVLGIFIATFTYALLVLRVVRGEEDGLTPEDLEQARESGQSVTAFVPHLSVTVAVLMAVVGIGFLIYFIDHAARSVQASVIIDRVTSDALRTLDRRLPVEVGEAGDLSEEDATPMAQGTVITSNRSGYVQGVDDESLMRLLHADSLTIRLEPPVGAYVLPGAALATVWPAGSSAREDVEATIRSAFVLGHERTNHLDVELGIIELADIAVKALSPGVNDPTTAILCLDRLAEILLAAGRREPPVEVRRAPDGNGTLILPRVEFAGLVKTALDEIRHYGVENPRFATAFLERMGDLGDLLPRDRRTPIARQAAALLRCARRAISEESDLREVELAGERALDALGATVNSGRGGSPRVPARDV